MPPSAEPDLVADLPLDQAHAFIGSRADYYLPRWRRASTGSRALGFNLAAAVFTLHWLLYRRMYRAFWIATGTIFAVLLVEQLVLDVAGIADPPKAVNHITVFAMFIAFGRFGTHWYYRHARRQIRGVVRGDGEDLTRIARLRAPTWGSTVLAVGTFLAFLALTARAIVSPP